MQTESCIDRSTPIHISAFKTVDLRVDSDCDCQYLYLEFWSRRRENEPAGTSKCGVLLINGHITYGREALLLCGVGVLFHGYRILLSNFCTWNNVKLLSVEIWPEAAIQKAMVPDFAILLRFSLFECCVFCCQAVSESWVP